MPLSDQLTDILQSLQGFGVVLWLAGAFGVLLVAELLLLNQTPTTKRRWLAAITLLALAVALVGVFTTQTRGFLFLHLLFLDRQAIVIQAIVLISTLCVVVYDYATYSPDDPAALPAEWYALLVATVVGLVVMSMSVNLLGIYLSMEVVSVGSYLLVALNGTRQASEGGLKYLLFGAVSSALMLYGMSLLYGMSGTLDLTADAMGRGLSAQAYSVAGIALLLTLSGPLFKLSGVPFHLWAPDAYQAAPTPIAAFLSVAPKAAALLVLLRMATALPLVPTPDGASLSLLQLPLAFVALAGMFVGNLSALRQTDAKRLLAYSGIAHAGFLLVGVVAMSSAGFDAALFYIGTYSVGVLAAFFLIDLLARSQRIGSLDIRQLAGLGTAQPLLSVALTIAMISLTGLPPTIGFTAKLLSFSALLEAWQQNPNGWLLALFGFGLLNAVIALAYYLRLPFLLFFRPRVSTDTTPIRVPAVAVALAVLLAVVTIVLFLTPNALLRLLTGFQNV